MPKVVFEDHYRVLGVARDATAEEIKKAYRKLLREHHPDLLGDKAPDAELAEANELLKELTRAWEQLSDPETREAIDLWLPTRSRGGTQFGFVSWDSASQREPITVPPAESHPLSGVWCWIEYHADSWLSYLKATVTIQLDDLFRVDELGDLPHGAWLTEVIAVDQKGDVVGRSYSLRSLRYDVRRLQAEARRNEERRVWRQQLATLSDQCKRLAAQGKPVGNLRALLDRARQCIDSGQGYSWRAEHRDTVVRSIREVQKEITRIEHVDPGAILLEDLLSGKIKHPDLAYNAALVRKLDIYAFRSGGAVTAPTPEEVQRHYQSRLGGLTDHHQVLAANLKLPDDEPAILELAGEGALELAPEAIQVQGNKGPSTYQVQYGRVKINGQLVPAGMIVVPESVYERNGASQHGRSSQFPELPHGITLVMRVRVRVQGREMLSDPYSDDKSLQNEVRRCRARLKNPQAPEELADTAFFLSPWPY
jgi:DnaJ domain